MSCLERSIDRCPFCQLDGLNQIFLSRETYEACVRTLVEPHIASIPPRVFAGEGFGLILTAAGDLYGIGKNPFQQISREDTYYFNQPLNVTVHNRHQQIHQKPS